MKYTYSYAAPVGPVFLAEEDEVLTALSFSPIPDAVAAETALLRRAAEQLEEYFEGRRQAFDLPLKLSGTMFQNAVWAALRTIPYGEMRSYRDIAAAVGNPNAARAVGMANNKNPIAIIVPCHRVVGADGRLVGYGGGLHIKTALLTLEARFK
jgi:methylated-DNA-[protein]-cysteine S-methyltransferase